MEIGHNVLHGQYDWTKDPALSSTDFEWDSSCPAKGWQHYHNYLHHTFTNITEKDRDLGYGVIRISAEKPWTPANLGNPLYALGLALIFDHGIMLHDVDFGHVRAGKKSWAEAKLSLKNGLRKSGTLAFRDYIMWPAFTGPLFLFTLAANALANVVRNIWAFIIIFCGHFPHGALEFTEEECEGRVQGPLVLPPDARLGQHHRAGACSTSCAATSASRSSTTSSPTFRPGATSRSPPRCGRSASATGSPTTRAGFPGSSDPSSGRSSAMPFPGAPKRTQPAPPRSPGEDRSRAHGGLNAARRPGGDES